MQRETKHAAVLSCAAKLFNTKGARSTTLADVASRLGLTKTSLYYYVSTKEDLIYQCYDANMRQAHAQLDAAEAARGRLRGSLVRYDRPFEPVLPADDWDMNR